MQEINFFLIPNFHSNCYSIGQVKVKFVTLKLELGQMEASLVCVSLYILLNALDYKQNKIKQSKFHNHVLFLNPEVGI